MTQAFPSIFPVACHTDNVGPGSLFVAIKGMKEDGVRYLRTAVERGATTLVIEHDVLLDPLFEAELQRLSISVMRVAHARRALALLAAEHAGHPARDLKIIGITGTKGKTTSSFLVEHLLRASGRKTALLSTVHNRIGDTVFPTSLTTPQPDYVHMFLKLCKEQGVEYVVMEAAAQAFTLHRLEGIRFCAGIFTNFSLEHSEFYPAMQEYFDAKVTLASQLSPQAFLWTNTADGLAGRLAQVTAQCRSFAYSDDADAAQAAVVSAGYGVKDEMLTCSVCIDNVWRSVRCPKLYGRYNVENLTGVLACVSALGVAWADIERALLTFAGVPGRLERYALPNGACAVVDYAHNPSSFEAVLSTLARETDHLIVVFGAGGERGHDRRPLMGATAARWAAHVILTTDNPRGEDPVLIMQDIQAGISAPEREKVAVEYDRQRAIEHAYALSRPGSVIAILGKGRDDYQLINGVKSFFSDTQVVNSLMVAR